MLLALRVVGNILFLVGGLFYCKYLVFPMGGFSDKMKIENCWKTVSGRAAERDFGIVS